MNQQATGFEKDIEYMKTDIADMKVDIRRLNEKTDGIIASVSAVREELKESHGALRVEIRDTAADLRKDLHKLHVGMLGLFITAGAGILLVVARAMKWL